jgi:1,4-alpha-glucan branching enzyme
LRYRLIQNSSVLVLLIIVASAGCAGGLQDKMPPKGGYEIVEGGVLFRYYDAQAKKVFLVGDFNRWTPTMDPMVDKNGDGEWTLFYPLPPGRYEYKFIVNGLNWIPDPRNPNSVSDGFDGENSVVIVPAR